MIADLISKLQLLNSDEEISLAIQKQLKDGKFSFNQVVEFLKTDIVDTKCWGIQILAEYKTKQCAELLTPFLNDDSNEVQYCAAMGMRINPQSIAIPHLIDKLHNVDDPLLLRLIGDALIAIGENATTALISITEGKPSLGVIEAVRALAFIKDKNSIGALFNLITSPSAQVQYWAEKGLHDMGIGMAFFDPS